jgi:hypothetical protein
MRGVILTKVNVEKEKRITLNNFLKKHILIPFISGMIGYLGFFTILMISKYLGFLIGNRISFQVDITDFLISLLGFAFIFVVKLKENTKERIL